MQVLSVPPANLPRFGFASRGLAGWVPVVLCLLLGQAARAAERQKLHGHVPAAVVRLKPVDRPDAGKRLHLAIGLPVRNQAALTKLVQDLYDPASPSYGKYLTPAQFTERFGPSEQDYQAVAVFAKTHGVKVSGVHPNRLILDVEGAVADVEKAFHVTLRTYQHPKEARQFFAPDGEPSLDLAVPVLHVSGLDNYAIPHPNSHLKAAAQNANAVPAGTGSASGGGYAGGDFRAAYVPGTALTGAGQSVGLLEFDGYYASDITAYKTQFGLPNISVVPVAIDGGIASPGGNNAEVALDIETAMAMAPGLSTIYVYECPGSWIDMLNRMATDNLAKQLSCSWGTSGSVSGAEAVFQQMAAQGQSFFTASGDSDAYTGVIGFPSDSPSVTVVGGTTLTTTGPGGTYVSETVWNWGSGTGSSGGISTTYGIPSWQTGISMTASLGSTKMRNIPDVALTADNVYVLFNNGGSGNFGGTSCAAPLWAGFTALVNQQAVAAGRPTVGFINPAIYTIGKNAGYTTAIHDTTAGNNASPTSRIKFPAVTGYDLATGWGTPNGTALINALAAAPDPLQASSAAFLASGSFGGPFTPSSQTYTLTNGGASSLTWSASKTQSWTSLSATGGTLAPGAFTTVTWSINTSANTLVAGNYLDTISFTNTGTGVSQVLGLNLIVAPPRVAYFPLDTDPGWTRQGEWAFGAPAGGGGASHGGHDPASAATGGNVFGINLKGDYATATGGPAYLTTGAINLANYTGTQLRFKRWLNSDLQPYVSENVDVSNDGIVWTNVWNNGTSTATTDAAWTSVQYDISAVADKHSSVYVRWGHQVGAAGAYAYSGWNIDDIEIAGSPVQELFVSLSSNNVTEGAAAVTATLSTSLVPTSDTVVSLSSSDTSSATVPPTVTIPAGQASVTFPVTIVDDALLNGSRQVTLTASSSGYWTGTNTLTVNDNETATLTVTAASSVSAAAGSFQGTVTLSAAPVIAITLPLTSSDSTTLQVPAMVTIPAGQTTVSFTITVINDGLLHGTRSVTLTAHEANWTDGVKTISVLDSVSTQLTLFAPITLIEGGSGSGSVSTVVNVASATVIALASNNAARLTVPATVTIPAGSSSASFTVTAVDNVLTDGTATVTITASNASLISASATTTVFDNDVHHYAFSVIPSPQQAGIPFIVTLAAKDVNGVTITSYTGTATLMAAGTGGADTLTPSTTGSFVAGVWTGNATISNADTNVVLTASDGSGHTGASNAFTVATVVPAAVVEPVPALTLQQGNGPHSALVIGADGNLYGTTQTGGSSNQGTVFKMTTAGVITTLVSFYGANGEQPLGGLVLATDTNFYGTTSAGGSGNLGTIFKMTPAGVLTTMVNLTSITGSGSKASLVQASDGNFYGTTSAGGTSSLGTIFKMTPAGVVTVLVNFSGTSGTGMGASCQTALIQAADGNLYGTTSTGGTGNLGAIFKVTTAGVFTNLASFTGTTGAVLGSAPLASLVQASDTNLYGVTSGGGTSSFGTAFEITTAGVFTSLFSFTGTAGSFPGSSPQGALVQWATDGTLYGTTNAGGTNSSGTIFKTTTAGAITSLRSFSSSSDGANPYGAVVLASDGKFYGTMNAGGLSLKGVVYSLAPSTATFTRVFSFSTSPPVYKNLISGSDGNLYGTQVNQPGVGINTVFKLTTGGAFTNLPLTLTTSTSTPPFFIQGSDGNLYGDIPGNLNGSLYKLTTGGTFTSLDAFTGTTGAVLGQTPGQIIQGSDGLIYGASVSGGSGGGGGTVFKVTTAGTFTSLASFTGTTGAVLGTNPQTALVQGADGNFYGTTNAGGSGGGFGTVFKVTPAGVFTTLVNFTGTSGAALGTNPNTNLLLASDGNFYGTTVVGGLFSSGTVYKIAANGTFTSLLSFTGNSGVNLGSQPTANLIQGSDGNLYGTTNFGGVSGQGTVYKVTTAGVLTTLVSFTGSSGAAPGSSPQGTLKQGVDGWLYGTTTASGLYGMGTVFRISTTGAFQNLYSFGTTNDGGSPNSSGLALYSDSYRLIAGSDGYLYGVNNGTVFRVHQQPAPVSLAATSITATGATLSGSVTPNQDASTVYYQYGLTTNYGSQTALQNLTAGAGAVAVNATLTGLAVGTIYHYRLVTVTSLGTFFSTDQTFSTGSPPLVVTGSWAGAGQTGFTLDGLVNPLGLATTYYFQYGYDATYPFQTAPLSAGSGLVAVPVSATINSLSSGVTYYARLVATNSSGTAYGDAQLMTALPAAGAVVQPEFQYLNTGSAPLAGLSLALDGNFYGTMSTGGTFGAGTVFRLSPGGTLTTLANFYNSTNGVISGLNPQCDLAQGADGSFYGTTNSAGASGYGCIFKLAPNGQVTILDSFTNTSGAVPGANPASGLTAGLDGNFYGVTQSGGASSAGTVFKVTPAGVFTSLVSFTGTSGSYLGSSPKAKLMLGSDGNFYGTASAGGTGGFGTIFKVTPAGVLTTLVNFTGTTGAAPGGTPFAALVQGSDGNFYGTTSTGGANSFGTIFAMTPAGTLTTLVNFTGTTGAYLGSSAKGALIEMPDGNFYGTTQTGGSGGVGTIFQVSSGGVFNSLVSFTGTTGGALGTTPNGALVAGAGGALYGTTNSGGLNNAGSVFKATTAGQFTTLVNVTAAPQFGRLTVAANGSLYGTTFGGGGSSGYGTFFSAPVGGAPTTLATLVPTSGTTALNARAGLVQGSDGNFYAATQFGGTSNLGSVIQLTPTGTLATLFSFTGTTGAFLGSSPQAPLIVGSDGSLYGTAFAGGATNLGTVFKTTLAGAQTSLLNFTGNSGAFPGSSPQSPLTLGSDGNYYGLTLNGANGLSSGVGTIFKMTPAGVLTSLVSFTGTIGPALGSAPLGALVQGADGNFYGTASGGGSGGSALGTIFKVTPAGVFTSLANFTGTNGTLPGQTLTGGLFAGLDGHLYGVTAAGGAYGLGTIFRVASDGTVASLYAFSGAADGTVPNNGLALSSDGTFHGGNNQGIFHFIPPPVPLTGLATNFTADQATLNGTITGESFSGQVYFQYGITTSYGSSTSPQSFVPGYANVPVSAGITGVQPLLSYHYRLVVAGNSGNTYYGPDNVFTTSTAIAFNTAATVPITAASYSASGQSLAFSIGFTPPSGTTLMLVNNTGFSPVSGTFNNLPEGSTLTVMFGGQPYLFQISYVGGDGNDITLTAVSQAISFPAIAGKLTTDVPFALTATATSGLTVSYNIVAGAGSASVSGSTLTLTGTAGTVSVQATQAGNGSYGAAAPVVRTFSVSAGSPFTQVAGSKGNDVFLGIRANGTLWGWGYGFNSQIGIAATNQTVPVQVGVATTWKAVSVGGSHTVAVRTDGTLWAWGTNTFGQVGDGTTTTRTSPVQVGVGTTWALAAAGTNHTVAVKTDGTLWSWGTNASGQLGQGTTDGSTHSSPVQVGALTTWKFTGQSLSAGGDFTLALKSDGSLWAWGVNGNGQIGNGSITNATAPVQIGAATSWTSLAAGSAFSAALRSDGTLWSWGANSSGQLGDGTLGQNINPTQVGTAANWQSLMAGSAFATAIRTDGTLWTWGANLYGQLGQGFNDVVVRGNVPTQVGTATNWQLIAPSLSASLAVKSDGTPWSWGFNNNGELGYYERLPLPVAAQFGAVSMAAGGYGHSLAVKSDGTLWAWGYNVNGQLGLGSSDSGPHVAPGQVLPGALWTSVAAGGLHTMAVKNDGTLWGWGFNTDGELGDGTTTQRNSPVQIGTASNWLTVAAGYYHTLAIKTDGTLWAWGNNFDGQVGNGTTANLLVPLQVGTDRDWVAIAGGFYHSMALKQGGTLWAWGYNGYGQLGDGTTTNHSSPEQVGTARNWRSISAGYFHTVATQTDGSLWAWGYNFYGQIGDGTQTSRTIPVQAGADISWNTVVASGYQTLGTKINGTLWSWGFDSNNQLGDGGTNTRFTPAQVGTSAGWLAPFKGVSQSLVTTVDGTLWGFGYANYGTIGYAWRNQFVPDLVLPALSAAQTMSFPTLGNLTISSTVTLAATSSSGLPASYIVAGPAKLNGNQLTVTGTGTISVIAYQAGDSYWQSSDIAAQYVNPVPPSVTTDHVDTITTTSATVYGYVNPDGLQTTAQFLSGLTTAYGQSASVALAPANGTGNQNVSATITGLTPGTTYHFAVSATNVGGTTTGLDLAFTTLAPGITVFDGTLAGTALTDGVSAVDFGTVTSPQSATRTFTIQNTGTAALMLTTPVTVDGANPGEFVVDTSALNATVAAGTSTTFTVTYSPSAAGSRSAALHIASNALGALSAFDINLSGTGLLPQTISFGAIAQQSCGTPLALAATTTSSLPVSYAITAGGGIASLAGGTLNFTAPGSVTIQATQSGNTTYAAAPPASQTFTVVKGTQTITFDAGVPATASYSSLVTLAGTSNFGLVPVTFFVVSGPGGVAGNALTFSGPGAVTVQASQAGNAAFNPAMAQMLITAFNTPPVAADGSAIGDENTTLTGIATATDAQGTALTFAKVSSPAHGTLTFNSNGSYSYVPATYFYGTDSFTFKANDGYADSNIATITLTVRHVNQAPVSVNGTAVGDENTTLTGVVTATDVDVDPLTYAPVTGPAHGTLTLNGNGTFSYVPVTYFHGTDSFTFKANDGVLDSNVSTVTLTVRHVNQAPVATNATVVGNENTTITGVVPATDVDADSLTFTKMSSTAHGTLTLNPNGSFSYVPVTYFYGADSFTFKANDGVLDSNVATITFTVQHVNQAPVAAAAAALGDENTTLTGTVTATDVELDPLTFSKVTGPAHGSLTFNSNGSFSYVPVQYFHGTDSFTFKANDGQLDSNIATVTLTVNHVNQAPVSANGSAIGNENTTLTGTVTATDVDVDPLSYFQVTGPAHGTLTLNANGSFSYVPAQYFHGTDSFTFKANDGQLDSNISTITLTVTHVNQAPVSANGSATGNENTTLTGAATATDVDVDPLTYAQVTGPAHGTLTFNGNGSFSYVPVQYYHGTDSFTFKANDGQLDSNIATVTLTVNHVNQAPVSANGSAIGNENTTLTGTVTATDVDADPLSYFQVTGPAHGTLTLNPNGSFSYVPVQYFHGTDTFTFKANDGQLDSNISTITLTVTHVNQAPVSANGSAIGNENTTLTGAATATDVDVDPLTYAQVTGPAHGTLTFNGNGSFSYVPVQYYHGADSFTFKANDGQLDSNIATVTLTVNHVNQAPVSANGSAIGNENTTLTGTVTATDVDVDPLSYFQVNGPAHGTLTLNPNGSFSYVPATYFHGTDSFTFKANDGQIDSNISAVTLTVNHVNQAPVATNATVVGNENTTITGIVPATDVDADSLTFTKMSSTAHGTLTLNPNGSYSYVPVTYFYGTDSFTFKANDGLLDSNVATLTFTVQHLNQAPVATNGTAIGDENTTLTGTVTATDVDGNSLTYAQVTGTAHGTLTFNGNGSFNYVPVQYFHGTDSFTFKANDGVLDSNISTLTLTVRHVNQAPVAADGSAIGDENTTLTGTATATDVDGDPLTFVKVAGAAHGTVVLSPNGSFTYTPVTYYHGTDSFTFKANDGVLDSNVSTITLTVRHVNQAPVAADGSAIGDENTTLIGTATATDVDVDPLTFAKVTDPVHGTLTFHGDGTFSYVPVKYYHGTDSFTFKANDGVLDSNVSTLTLTVRHVNQAPVATDGTANGDENTTLTGTAAATDVDVDPLTFIKVTDPAHGTLTFNGDGTFSYVPAQYYHGTDSFTFKANDGGLDSNISTITLTVRHVNQAPVAADGSAIGDENTTLTGAATATDVDIDPLTFAKLTGPAHGTLTFNGDGTFSYVPVQYFHGTDSFTFKANDSVLDSNIATLTLTVRHVNHAPVATDGSAIGDENTTLTGAALATDVDVDPLSFIKVTGPAHGTLTLNGDGTFSYVPVQYYSGSDSFTFKANDGVLDSNVSTIVLTVHHVNQAPVVKDTSATGVQGNLVRSTVTGTDVEGDALTFAQVTAPAHGALTLNADGTYAYRPDADFMGTDTFTCKANDGQADSNIATVTLVIITTVPQWTWMDGPSTANVKGAYGALGTAAAANTPGARQDAATWSDGVGHFWMFGGTGYAATTGPGALNDLWTYDVAASTWTWLNGGNAINVGGTYGTQGTAAAANTPGARTGAATWSDRSGNLWLFGGNGRDSSATGTGYLNDLWIYNPAAGSWTSVGGPNLKATAVAVSPTSPEARSGAATWVDAAGRLMLFGGRALPATGTAPRLLNDLWRYDTGTNGWTLLRSGNAGQGTYGVVGAGNATTQPGARADAVSWMDTQGRMWLFGGSGFATTATSGNLNDLWCYDATANRWTWINGASTINAPGVYGTLGTTDPASHPGARSAATGWTDATGAFWLFGGTGSASGTSGLLNDVWCYQPAANTWTWMKGPSTPGIAGAYGTPGIASSANTPGARQYSLAFPDANGNLWLFGGNNGTSYYSDSWRLTLPPAPVALTFSATDGFFLALPGPNLGLAGEPSPSLLGGGGIVPFPCATLWASVNPNGLPTTGHFRYSTHPDLSNAIESPDQDLGAGISAVSMRAWSNALLPGATYYVQAVTVNSFGSGTGQTFIYIATGTAPSPVAGFTSSGSAVSESAGTVSVTVQLSAPSTTTVTIPFTLGGTATATDYTAPTSPLTFVPGQTVTTVDLKIRDDVVHEPNETVIITLGTPTGGVTLGSTSVYTLTIIDNDFAPQVSSPASVFATVGSSTTFSPVATGSGPLTYQWKKNGADMAGATSATYTLASIALTSMGNYSLQVSNPTGGAISSAAELSVIDAGDHSLVLAPNATATLTVGASSPGTLTYQWLQDGVAMVDAPTRITGSNTKTLIIKLVTTADAADYTCVVTCPDSGLTATSGHNKLAVVSSPPAILTAGTLTTGVVGGLYTYPIVVDGDPSKAPSSFTVTGLPAGLSVNAGGLISGRPIAAVTSKAISITASNSSGPSLVQPCTLTILPLPTTVPGTFAASVARQPGVADNLGARVDITPTGAGAFTAKLTLNGLTVSTSGLLTTTLDITGPSPVITAITGHVLFPRTGKSALVLDFVLDAPPNTLTGTLTDAVSSASAAVTGFRNPWNATTSKATIYKGYYTFGLDIDAGSLGDQSIPQGNGFGSFTVADDGTLTFAGRTADNIAFTTASFAGPAGQVIVFAPSATNLGSLIGIPVIVPDAINNHLTGFLSWNKGPASATSTDYAYPSGFAPLNLAIVGGKYTAPAAGGVVMGLLNSNLNARLSFFEGGLLSGQSPPVVFSIRNNSATGTTQTITVPAAGGVANPAKVSFVLVATPLGQFNGNLTIANATPALVRATTYQGTIIRLGNGYQALGCFLLPQLPQPGQTLSTSPKLSGQVLLEVAVP